MNDSRRFGPDKQHKYTAGFEILDKFQSQWELIHKQTMSNVNKAKMALTKLNSVEQSCTKRLCAMDSFVSSYKSIYQLEEQINNISCDLEKLENYFVKIEDQLLILKARKARLDTERFIKETEKSLEIQIQKETSLSESRKDKLMAEHLARVHDLELMEQQKLEERRQILERQFEEEKKKYLESAKLDRS